MFFPERELGIFGVGVQFRFSFACARVEVLSIIRVFLQGTTPVSTLFSLHKQTWRPNILFRGCEAGDHDSCGVEPGPRRNKERRPIALPPRVTFVCQDQFGVIS